MTRIFLRPTGLTRLNDIVCAYCLLTGGPQIFCLLTGGPQILSSDRWPTICLLTDGNFIVFCQRRKQVLSTDRKTSFIVKMG